MTNRAGESIYVGYRPLPPRHRLFVRLAAPALVMVFGGLAAIMAAAQRDPGDAVWASGEATEHTGSLVLMPYPVLMGDDGDAHVVVEMGKVGAHERLAPFAGERITLRGWTLQRNRQRMIELDTATDAVHRAEGAPRDAAVVAAGEELLLRGELLDSKCYLGAMKPGDGKGHKACATLCIDGGIPPALLTWDALGRPRTVLIAAGSIEETARIVRPFLGEPVAVRGRLTTVGTLEILSIGPGAVRRR